MDQVNKKQKTRQELAEMILAEVRKIGGCEGIKSVNIPHITDERVDFTWDVEGYNPGTSDADVLHVALGPIVRRLQKQYDLKG